MKKNAWSKKCTAILAGSLAFLAFPINGISQVDNAGGRVDTVEYVIEDIKGPNAQVLEEGETQWEKAQEGQVVDSGDEVKVGEKSEVTLMMQTETSVHLGENTDLKVEQIAANETGGFLSRLKVMAGLVLADVKKHLNESHSTFEVESNGVVCGVRGTAFEVNAHDGESQISTHEGKVEVYGEGESHMVTEGNLSSFKRGKFLLQRRLAQNEVLRFQRWRAVRQAIRQKRMQRLADILRHKRQPWQRKHPQLNNQAKRKLLGEIIRRKHHRKAN